MIDNTTAARKVIERATISLLIDEPFFGLLVYKLDVIGDHRHDTFATDGIRLWYNPDFAMEVFHRPTGLEQIKAVLAHEVLHCAFGHQYRRQGREADKWFRATDYVINAELVKCRFTLPPEGLIDMQWLGHTAEYVFTQLPDTPSFPRLDFGKVIDGPPGSAQSQSIEWDIAVQQAYDQAGSHGSIPQGIEQAIAERRRPRVDWRTYLADFIDRNCDSSSSWMVPNRRYAHSGIILPSIVQSGERVGEIVNAVDTSMSCCIPEWQAQFWAEMQTLVSTLRAKLYILHIDTQVHKAEVFDEDDQPSFIPTGGGGTDFRPAFEWVSENGIDPKCLIYMTDMLGSFPTSSPNYPVLWLNVGDPSLLAPFGETIHIDMEEFR